MNTNDDLLLWARTYNIAYEIDGSALLLSSEERNKIHAEMHKPIPWSKTDVAVIACAGLLGAAFDLWLVDKVGDAIKKTVSTDTPPLGGMTRKLEEQFPASYDANSLEGMYPRTHRFQTPGHDPIAGLFFGVKDLVYGTVSGYGYDKASGRHFWQSLPVPGAEGIDPLLAIIFHLGHLLSDVATPMGLPAPLMTLLQGINIEVPWSPKQRTVGEIARWMYLNGYDLRAFLAQGIVPGVIEIVVRGYFLLCRYAESGNLFLEPEHRARMHEMLVLAHAITCAGNAAKTYFRQGDPLAINYPEWIALMTRSGAVLHWHLLAKQKLAAQRGRESLCLNALEIRDAVM